MFLDISRILICRTWIQVSDKENNYIITLSIGKVSSRAWPHIRNCLSYLLQMLDCIISSEGYVTCTGSHFNGLSDNVWQWMPQCLKSCRIRGWNPFFVLWSHSKISTNIAASNPQMIVIKHSAFFLAVRDEEVKFTSATGKVFQHYSHVCTSKTWTLCSLTPSRLYSGLDWFWDSVLDSLELIIFTTLLLSLKYLGSHEHMAIQVFTLSSAFLWSRQPECPLVFHLVQRTSCQRAKEKLCATSE